VDFSKYCTSLVEIVISEIITSMVFDVSLSTILNSDLGKITDQSCSSDLNAVSATNSGTFNVTGAARLLIFLSYFF
jgi:hypothetical protein